MTDLLVTDEDRSNCFKHGHDVTGWGTICGWCKRCHHSVWTYDGRSVLMHGEFHRYPPPHTPESEKRLREMGYTRGGVPAPRPSPVPRFSRDEALGLHGREDDYLRERGLLDA